MALMPVFGLNNGMIPIVSYNYGAKKPDRMTKAVKCTLILAVSIMIFFLIVMQLIPEQILKLFDATDEMLSIGVPALRIMSISFIFAGFCIIMSGLFQALGKGVYSLIVSLARQLVVLLPRSICLCKNYGKCAVCMVLIPDSRICKPYSYVIYDRKSIQENNFTYIESRENIK